MSGLRIGRVVPATVLALGVDCGVAAQAQAQVLAPAQVLDPDQAPHPVLPVRVPDRIEQPRPVGHFVGDVVQQRVLLEQGGRAFTLAALPAPARLSRWLERRPARQEVDDQGHAWLVVDYQILGSPLEAMTIGLPRWEVSLVSAKLAVASATLELAPLASAGFAADAGAAPPAQRAVPPRPDAGARRWQSCSAWTLGACLGLWLIAGLWCERRARLRPFAAAFRQLRACGETSEQSWRALHQAIDRTAGRAIHRGSLSLLLARAPHLEPVREELQAFFDGSARRFFGAPQTLAPSLSLLRLCRQLKHLERQAHG